MITRNPIVTPRQFPAGFGWIDHRFLRCGHIRSCSTQALALYLLLVLAADSRGISFYGDRLIRHLLGFGQEEFEEARACLLNNNLIVWERPVYQVIALTDREGLQQ